MAVVGLGGVGMNALLGGVVAGAERIVAVDLNADKLRLARELGATDTFLAGNADVVEEIRQATGGGLDYVIETAGSIPAMNLAYAIAARGGTVVSAGLPASTATFSYLHSALVSDGKSIMGSYMGGCVPKRDIPRFIALYQRGKLPMQRLRTGYVLKKSVRASIVFPTDRSCVRFYNLTPDFPLEAKPYTPPHILPAAAGLVAARRQQVDQRFASNAVAWSTAPTCIATHACIAT
jgi:alcohol dehydrogenase